MNKGEPTISYDPKFVLDSEFMRNFVNECVNWARKLHEISGGISLKFVSQLYDDHAGKHAAEFRWNGVTIVYASGTQRLRLDGEKTKQFVRDLADDNIGASTGSWVSCDELWEKAFRPSLCLAITREIDRFLAVKKKIQEAPHIVLVEE